MKLLIDISKNDYEEIKEYGINTFSSVAIAIQNGTPLPKGHGDLIDSNVLCEQYKKTCGDLYQALDLTPIIIEADKENKE